MIFRQMRICVPASITKEFNASVRAAFPKETLAYLIGRQEDNQTLHVESLFFPPGVLEHATGSMIDVQPSWFRLARRAARIAGQTVIGDIHSHPYTLAELAARKVRPDCSPSECDLERSKIGLVAGICLAVEQSNGKVRLRTRYWGPMVPIAEVVKPG